MRTLGLYDFEGIGRSRQGMAGAVVAILLASLIVTSLFYLLDIPENGLAGWQLIWIVSAMSVVPAERYFGRRYVDQLVAQGQTRRRVGLYATADVMDKVAETLTSRSPDIELVDKHIAFDGSRGARRGCPALAEMVRLGQLDVYDQIVVALPINHERLPEITAQLSVLPLEVVMLPDLDKPLVRSHGMTEVAGLPAVRLRVAPLSERQLMVKGAFDAVVAAAALLLLAPLFAVIALAIKLHSSGPVFFLQRRHGYNHRIFKVVKFRTMSVMEDGASVRQASKSDCRVTRIGGFLRRTSLDELPQLWNVLAGDMSLVGPRPHALSHNQYYSELWPDYANRHRMKPGITGLAQVQGYRGETLDPRMMRRRYILDLLYISKWSIGLDLLILVKTVLVVLSRKNAF